ncbi:MAG: CarD family transcriptional regulator [bacterium]
MFKIGDKILHPLHGVAIVEQIEEKEVLGQVTSYYILNLFMKKMRVMVPIEKADEVGIRRLSNTEQVQEAFDILKSKKTKEFNANWNRRYRHNLDQIKTGNICKVAEVLKSLSDKQRKKGLSMGEKKMVENIRQLIIGEIMYAKKIKQEQASTLLDKVLH